MSVKAMTWAFDQDLPPMERLVLLVLADHADDKGYCFPGAETICRRSGVKARTLTRILASLEESGYIARERRFLTNGNRTSDGYRLQPNGDKTPVVPLDQTPNDDDQTHAVAAVGEPSVEPSVTATARARTMPMDLTWSNAHSIKAGSKGVDVDVEFAKFQDYHLARGSKFVDWERAFHTWLNNARPDIGRGSQRPDSRPSRDEEIMAFLASPTPRQEPSRPAIERPKTTECPFCPELFEDDGAVMRHIHRDHPEGN